MTTDEYKIKLKELEDKHALEINALIRDCAFSNNPYQFGDIIQDHRCIIKIDKIKYGRDFVSNLPTCVYYGSCLKKDLTPKKNGDREQICQSNIIKKL